MDDWEPMFCDTRRCSNVDSYTNDDSNVRPPYSSESFIPLSGSYQASAARDMWSIGVVMLEILVGTAIIVSNPEYRQIRNVLAQSQEFLDAKTSGVLCQLLFKEGTADLGAYLSQTLESEPNLIGEAVRGLEAASVDIKILSDLDRAGRRYVLAEKAELKRKFKIETD
jgi:hypothetical protein